MKRVRFNLFVLLGIALFLTACTGCSDSSNNSVPAPTPTPIPTPTPTESVVPAPEEVVMYEANPRLYGTSNCLQGLTNRLSEIKALGTNVLWIMPICEFGVKNSIGSPYCIKDYKKVDAKYGTIEDLRNLVEEAHNLGMAVILDWIANHTSWDNVWISNKDWYTQDGAGNIISPEGTGWNDVADLNFNNTSMRNAMIDAMKYWVREADIDGFRCDAADMVPDDFWASAVSQLRNAASGKTLLMLAEGSKASHFDSGFDMNYAWDYYDTQESVFKGQSAKKIYQQHETEYKVIPKDAVKLRFTTNHDKTAYNGTPIEIYGGKEGSLAALAITAFMGGAPLLYSSQECAQATGLDFQAYYNYDWDKDVAYTNEVKKMMQIRATEPVFVEGRLQDYSEQDVVMFYRLNYPDEALVVANVRNSQRTIALPANLAGKSMTDAMSQKTETLPSELTLGAYEYHIWIK